MQCPKCGAYMQPVTHTTSDVKGFGFFKGCFGYLILGPIGWLCGLCGMGKGRTTSHTNWHCPNCGHHRRG